MQAEFRPPRRRPRVQDEYDAPLPVSRSSEEACELRAELINDHVVVCNPDHIQKIYNQGYFGKGVLSRAGPSHSISSQWEQHEGLCLPVVSQSRYETLLTWAEAALSAQGLDEEAVRQKLLHLSQSVDVRREVGEGGGSQKEKEGAEREVPRPGSGSEMEARRSCSSDTEGLNPDHQLHLSSEQDTDLCSDPELGHGLVVVVPDNEADGCCREIRRIPFYVSEYLQLSLEEAFFLVYSLGCLSVYLNQEPQPITELWGKFRSLRPDFISTYAAYHHFRSRGWVPKGGGAAKYGADLMLYRKGPPFYHASYSVVIERVDDAFRGSALRSFTWRSLAALSRITANVSKELMLCYIIFPGDLSNHELDSPECLRRLKVQEVLVSRWVSSRERAEQDDF